MKKVIVLWLGHLAEYQDVRGLIAGGNLFLADLSRRLIGGLIG